NGQTRIAEEHAAGSAEHVREIIRVYGRGDGASLIRAPHAGDALEISACRGDGEAGAKHGLAAEYAPEQTVELRKDPGGSKCGREEARSRVARHVGRVDRNVLRYGARERIRFEEIADAGESPDAGESRSEERRV